MARQSKWSDDYWILLLQLYLRKPAGVKPMFSRAMVDLSLELHIRPDVLYGRMQAIANLETPRIRRIWQTYSNNPRLLSRAARLLRGMEGFNSGGSFYADVVVNESFEQDFRPVDGTPFTPMMLVIILSLYFRLTPATMVSHTPEVVSLARMMGVEAGDVAQVLRLFLCCDPYFSRSVSGCAPGTDCIDRDAHPLMPACRRVWQRFGNGSQDKLDAHAKELMAYFAKI